MGVNEDDEVNEKLNKPKRYKSFFAKAGNIFGNFFVGGRRKNRKTRKNKKRKSKKSKKNIKKKAPTKKRRVRKNKKTKRKKGGTKRKMDDADFEPIATIKELEKDLKMIEKDAMQQQQQQEMLDQEMLRQFDGPADPQPRVEVDAALGIEQGPPGPLDSARRQANAEARRANYERALAALKSKPGP